MNTSTSPTFALMQCMVSRGMRLQPMPAGPAAGYHMNINGRSPAGCNSLNRPAVSGNGATIASTPMQAFSPFPTRNILNPGLTIITTPCAAAAFIPARPSSGQASGIFMPPKSGISLPASGWPTEAPPTTPPQALCIMSA